MFGDDEDYSNVIMDTHQYFAWWSAQDDIGDYCDGYGEMFYDTAPQIKYDIWVGEWSLATDVCAHWLGGFNDSNTAYQYECQKIECPYSYLPAEYAVDFDRQAPTNGPYGTSARSTIEYGECYNDSQHFSSKDVGRLGQCSYDIFNGTVEGQFLWCMRNEIESKWSYVQAYDEGWLPKQKAATETFLQ